MLKTERLPETSFATLAIALLQERRYYSDQEPSLELFAHQCKRAGLNETVCETYMAERRRHKAMIEDAHVVMKAACRHETAIRRVIAFLSAIDLARASLRKLRWIVRREQVPVVAE